VSLDVFIPTPDPYVGLFGLLGGKPQVLCHGDDLPSGVVSTWSARHGALAGTVAGTVSRNDTGWAGGGGLTLPTLDITSNGQWVEYDSEAANYSATTDFLWVGAVKYVTYAAVRYCCFLGSSSVGNNWRGFQANATTDIVLMTSNRNGTSETDNSSVALIENTQSIWALLLKGGTVHMIQRTLGGGDTVILNSLAHTQSGTLTVNKFTLGALVLSGAQVNNGAHGSYRFFAAMRAPVTDVAGLPRVLDYVQHRLRCPL